MPSGAGKASRLAGRQVLAGVEVEWGGAELLVGGW